MFQVLFKLASKRYSAGETVQLQSPAANSQAIVTPTKVKEILINVTGTYRIKFDLGSTTGAKAGVGRIYIDGIPTGTQRQANGGYVTQTEDIYILAGQKVQLYYWCLSDDTYAVMTQNFKVCTAEPIIGSVIL